MKKYLLLVLCAGCSNVTPIGSVNGVTLTRITTRGVFSPSQSIVVAHDPKVPGVINPVASASGPGVLPAIATAGGVVAGAALLRPARENVTAAGTGGAATASGGAGGASSSTSNSNGGSSTSTSNGGSFIPPGQVSNPGHTN
jgi:hypothetical protein